MYFFSLFIYEKCSITECLKVIQNKSRDLLIAVIMNRIIEQRNKLGSVYIVNKIVDILTVSGSGGAD
jgi:hypothetical protein